MSFFVAVVLLSIQLRPLSMLNKQSTSQLYPQYCLKMVLGNWSHQIPQLTLGLPCNHDRWPLR